MRRRNRRRNQQQRGAPAPPPMAWSPVTSFVNTAHARNIQWQENHTLLIFDAPNMHAEGRWDRWHFILRSPHDTRAARLLMVENNVRG